MAIYFGLSPVPSANTTDGAEGMHLRLDEELLAYFQRLEQVVATAGLASLDPYGLRIWAPSEVGPVAVALQRLAVDVEELWPSGSLGEWEPPEIIGQGDGRPTYCDREEVAAFLFWLAKVFLEAADRRLYVFAVGE